jgi:hypothetical protein
LHTERIAHAIDDQAGQIVALGVHQAQARGLGTGQAQALAALDGEP